MSTPDCPDDMDLPPDENAVVAAIRRHCEDQGWRTVRARTTAERGVDYEAHRLGERLFAECAGATSTVASSNRFGQPQTRQQAFISTARVIYQIMALRNEHAGDDVHLFIGLADTPNFRAWAAGVSNVLASLRVGVLFVDRDGRVGA